MDVKFHTDSYICGYGFQSWATGLIFFLFSCLDDTPELKKWTERMFEDPAVKATMHSQETYKIFYKSYSDGKPDYDYGL